MLLRRAIGLVALVLSTLALSSSPSLAAGEGAAREEAAVRFERGVKLYEAQDFAAALAEFEAAYRLVPRLAVLFNIGVTEKKLFRYNDAVRTLKRYLDEGAGDIKPERRAEVERELQEIRALVAEVTVTVEGPPAALDVDGRALGRTPLEGPLLLAAGAHVLRAARDGFDPAEQHIEVVSGEKVQVALAPRLKPKLPTTAKLSVITRPPGGELTVDGHFAGREPWSGTLDPGGHDIGATLKGFRKLQQEVVLTAGQARALTLELVALPPPPRWYKRWYTWTIPALVIAAAAGAGIGGYFATRPTYDRTISFPP